MANNTAKSVTLKDKNTNEFLYPYTSDSLVKRTNSTYNTVKEALDALEAGGAATNRAYDSTKNVQGYMVLQPNTGSVYAQLVGKENYIIEVRDIIDLDGEDITIPEGCTLKFEGGELTNGTVNFQNTGIEATRECFGDDLVITGKVLQEASPEWFSGSDADKIEKAVSTFKVVKLAARDYLLDRTVHIYHSFRLNGSSIPSNMPDTGTIHDYSSTRIMPSTSFCREVAKTTMNLDDTALDALLANLNSLKVAVRNAYTNSSAYSDSAVKARFDGVVPSLISIEKQPAGRWISAVISGVSFITDGKIENNDSLYRPKYVINGINFNTPGGPSRPIVIENCNFRSLNWGIYIYGSNRDHSTNVSRLRITGTNFSINNMGLYVEGRHAVGGMDIQDSIIEQNFIYGIYAPKTFDSNAGSSGEWYYPLNGYIRIKNILMEGQSDPINICCTSTNMFVEGCYYERSGGSTIRIEGNRPQESCIYFLYNPTSSNTSITYNIYNCKVSYVSSENGVFNLTNCIVDPTDERMKKTYLSKCISYKNGENKLTPVATFKFSDHNYIYDDVPCLLEIAGKNNAVKSSYTLQEALPAGQYVLAYLSDNSYLHKFTIGNDTILSGYTIHEYSSSYGYRFQTINVENAIPAGTKLTITHYRVGHYSTAYLFALGTGIYGLPYVDVKRDYSMSDIDTSTENKGSTADRPTSLTFDDVGYKYYDTDLNKQLVYTTSPLITTNCLTNISESSVYLKNNFSENQLVKFTLVSFGPSHVPQIIFAKNNSSIEDGIEIDIPDVSGNGTAARGYSSIISTPNPEEYPYIYFSSEYSGNTYLYYTLYTLRWQTEDGKPAALTQGTTENRPTDMYSGGQINFMTDTNFEYYDTTLKKYCFATLSQNSVISERSFSANETAYIANTLDEGYLYNIYKNNTYSCILSFANGNDASVEGYEEITVMKLTSSNIPKSFIALDASTYPYIKISGVTGSCKISIDKNVLTWIDEDGFTPASHRGASSEKPTLTSSDSGFQYYDTTLKKYICWNGSAWVNIDGTALT